MTLKIYNTLKREKEVFTPITPGKVSLYVCGITAYDDTHMGHARAYVAFDIIYRQLMHLGYDVNYVQNFTDIDDKIINRAKELGITETDLTEKYIARFKEDMHALNVLDANTYPKATSHISQMIKMIQALIDKGHAYEANGDVYFSVESDGDYGKLWRKKIDDLIKGHRVEVNLAK